MVIRTTLGRTLAVSLSIAVSQVAAPLAQAADLAPAPDLAAPSSPSRLVDSGVIAARLLARAQSRDEKVKLFQDALARPAVQQQARSMGLSADRLRAAVPHLSDKELADLESRAARAKDVVAGHSSNDGLVIVGLVLLLAGLAVLAAVADDGYDDDYCYCY